MNSLEQAAKCALEILDELPSRESIPGQYQACMKPIIAKHLDAFAKERNDDNGRLLEVNRLVHLQLAQLKEQNRELLKAEKETSDAYLRVRVLLNAFNTNHGGENRFEVTEDCIRELLKDKELLDLLDRLNGSLLLCFMGGAKFAELNLTGKESLRSAMVRDVLEIAKRKL